MPRINYLMVCGLIVAISSGCQTARSVTGHVAEWRPFGKTSPEAAAETDAVAAEESPSLGSVAEVPSSLNEDQAHPHTNDIRPVSGQVAAEPKVSPLSEMPETIPAPPQNASRTSFEDYIRSLEAGSDQKSIPVTQAAPKSIESPAAAPTKTVQVPAASGTGQSQQNATAELADQIESLLAGYRPVEDKTSARVEATSAASLPTDQAVAASAATAPAGSQQGGSEKQSAKSPRGDAAMVAFDLASFGDASVKKPVAKAAMLISEEPATESTVAAKPELSFADWARELDASIGQKPTPVQQAVSSQAVPAKTVETTTAAQSATTPSATQPIDDPFAWAAGGAEGLNVKTVSQTSSVRGGQSQAGRTSVGTLSGNGTSKPQISADVLSMLETALGSETWKSDPLAQATGTARRTAEQEQIVKLMQDPSSKVRLRGIRLAFEQSEGARLLAAPVTVLLDDANLTVQAHAASTLYHWQIEQERSLEVLAHVLTAGDEQAAQLAAMFLGDMHEQREKVVPVLETALLSTTGVSAMHVAEAMLKHDPKNVNAVAKLTELMRHEDVEVRWLTAHALGSVQGDLQPYAVEALRSGLRDVDSQVRATAALSLGGLGKASRVAVAELVFIAAHAEPKVKDAATIALDCIQR